MFITKGFPLFATVGWKPGCQLFSSKTYRSGSFSWGKSPDWTSISRFQYTMMSKDWNVTLQVFALVLLVSYCRAPGTSQMRSGSQQWCFKIPYHFCLITRIPFMSLCKNIFAQYCVRKKLFFDIIYDIRAVVRVQSALTSVTKILWFLLQLHNKSPAESFQCEGSRKCWVISRSNLIENKHWDW